MTRTSLTTRELDAIRWLDLTWRRPMDLGATDGSHHSATLSRLAKRGLVERKKIHAIYCYFGTKHAGKTVRRCCCKGSCRYRITKRGIKARAQALSVRWSLDCL